MDEKSQEINKLRTKLTNISELIDFGKSTKDYLAKHPASSVVTMILIGILMAFVSGGLIKLFIRLICFGLRVAAFIFVIRQTLDKFSGLFKVFSKKKK